MELSSEIKMFNIINSEMDDEFYWEKITNIPNLTYPELNDGVKKLANLGLIVNVSDKENKRIIRKLPKFYKASLCGGLEEYLKIKARKDKLKQDILESTITTNKNSRNSNRLAIIVGVFTLAALITQIVIDFCRVE